MVQIWFKNYHWRSNYGSDFEDRVEVPHSDTRTTSNEFSRYVVILMDYYHFGGMINIAWRVNRSG